eukprot:Trichotokara_eunicae@DN149_c0_g1_i1.p1
MTTHSKFSVRRALVFGTATGAASAISHHLGGSSNSIEVEEISLGMSPVESDAESMLQGVIERCCRSLNTLIRNQAARGQPLAMPLYRRLGSVKEAVGLLKDFERTHFPEDNQALLRVGRIPSVFCFVIFESYHFGLCYESRKNQKIRSRKN